MKLFFESKRGLRKKGYECSQCLFSVHEACLEANIPKCTHKIKAINVHKFREATFKKPTFCGNCDKLIVGILKQGLECESKKI